MKILIFLSVMLLCVAVSYAENAHSYSTVTKSRDATNQLETTIKISQDAKLGKILTDSEGMTLYMFTPDQKNISTCYDQCAVTWPPFVIDSGKPTTPTDLKGRLDVAKRRDNKLQVTYNGMPLYYYVKDTKKGDTYGQGVDQQWYVINPDTGPVKTSKKMNNQY